MSNQPDSATRPKKQNGHLKRTRSLYDALLAAYRERPQAHSFAARAAGCSRATARTAWEKGWPGISWGRPIQSRIQDEGDAAFLEGAKLQEQREEERKKRLDLEEAERERVKAERVKVLGEELQIQATMRKGVQQAGAAVLALSGPIHQVVRLVTAQLFDEKPGPDGKPTYTPKANVKIELVTAMKLVREWSNAMAKFVLAGDVVVSLGRETRGPDDAISAAPDMSAEEVEAEMDHLMKMAEGIKRRELEDAAEKIKAEKPTLQ